MTIYQLTYRSTVDCGGGEVHAVLERQMFVGEQALADFIASRTPRPAPPDVDPDVALYLPRAAPAGEDERFAVVSLQKLGPLTMEEMGAVSRLVDHGLVAKARHQLEAARGMLHEARVAALRRKIQTAQSEERELAEHLRMNGTLLSEAGHWEYERRRSAAAAALLAAEAALADLLASDRTVSSDPAEDPVQQSLPFGE